MLTLPWLSGGPHLLAHGVGHKPEAVPATGRPDTESWQYGRSEGVPLAFHVVSRLFQPFMGNRRRNLLSKSCWRFALADEPEPYWPKVAFVGFDFSFSGGAEGLAGATASPDGSIVRPTCHSEGDGPSADYGEEVTLGEALEVIGMQHREGANEHVDRGLWEATLDSLAAIHSRLQEKPGDDLEAIAGQVVKPWV